MTHTNEKAPGACNTEGFQNHTTNDLNYPTGQRPSKALANQIAQLAMAGHVVHTGQHGDFIVCKYGMTKYCADFAELQAFAVKLGVKHD